MRPHLFTPTITRNALKYKDMYGHLVHLLPATNFLEASCGHRWSIFLVVAAHHITSWRLCLQTPQGIPRDCLLSSILSTSFDDSVIIFPHGYVSKSIYFLIFSANQFSRSLICFIDLVEFSLIWLTPVCSELCTHLQHLRFKLQLGATWGCQLILISWNIHTSTIWWDSNPYILIEL